MLAACSPLGSTDNAECDIVAFIQALIPITLDGGVMNKYIASASIFWRDEAIALLITEPFDSTIWHDFFLSCRKTASLRRVKQGP